MAMSRPQPISVLLVASVCAALHGGAAVLFVPTLSFIMLCLTRTYAQGAEPVQTKTGMVFAVLLPVLATAFGFAAGAFMAFAHNVFADGQRKTAVTVEEAPRLRAASLGNVA